MALPCAESTHWKATHRTESERGCNRENAVISGAHLSSRCFSSLDCTSRHSLGVWRGRRMLHETVQRFASSYSLTPFFPGASRSQHRAPQHRATQTSYKTDQGRFSLRRLHAHSQRHLIGLLGGISIRVGAADDEWAKALRAASSEICSVAFSFESAKICLYPRIVARARATLS